MKKLIIATLTLGLAWMAQAADKDLGRLEDGTYYMLNEVDFALEERAARNLSPMGEKRNPVDTRRLLQLHPGILAITAGSLAPEHWLQGKPMPERIRREGPEVPMMARTLKAMLHPGQDAANVAEELGEHPDVEWAGLNHVHETTVIPNDAGWSLQWAPQRVLADQAWDIPQAATGIRIAIIDTGVDLSHPDLAGRIVYDKGFGPNSNGDAKNDQQGGSSIDHGTHVAGIAAAIRNNLIGVAGITRADIMAMGCAKWNDDSNQYGICCAANAINDAVANGADVINCSFSNKKLSQSEKSALNNAREEGVVVVVAAGNDGKNVDSSDSKGWNDHSWPLIVSNIRDDDTPNPSSNFGSAIDLGAPGTAIMSTVTPNFFPGPLDPGGYYTSMGGTSMASPAVAGGAALVKSMNPSRIFGAGLKSFLYRMAEDLGGFGGDDTYGNGMLRLDPEFLFPLREAHVFVNPQALPFSIVGTYNWPFDTLDTAVTVVPADGTIVLNGGLDLPSSFTYPPITITKACTLRAFPDLPVTIGE